MEIFDL